MCFLFTLLETFFLMYRGWQPLYIYKMGSRLEKDWKPLCYLPTYIVVCLLQAFLKYTHQCGLYE